jgi:(p)ppGpp synthase/HD superfamily hydrolase
LSALAYAARCHAGQVRESDGAPIIEHLSEVARLLRDAGCADVVIAAGLLHRVVQDTDVSAAALTERFGATVAGLVEATTIDCVGSYPQRKHALREQIRNADHAAAMVFAAKEIAEVRELSDQVRRDRARTAAATSAGGGASPLERYRQLRLREYHASLSMLQAVAPHHRLVSQLAVDLERCPISVRRPKPRAVAPSPAS